MKIKYIIGRTKGVAAKEIFEFKEDSFKTV